MAESIGEISGITLPNGSSYDLKDIKARQSYVGLSAKVSSLSDEFSTVTIKDPTVPEYASGKKSDLSVIKLTTTEYASMLVLSTQQPNAIYIVSDTFHDAYGLQLKNLAKGTDLSDAVTLEQLNDLSVPGKYILSASGVSSLETAKVNVVTMQQYLQLSADDQLISTELYAVDGDVFGGGSKVTVQHFTQAGAIQTEEADLSILCLSSMNQFRTMVANDQLQDNAIYKISGDYWTALGQRIGDLADPLCADDAVSLNYFEDNNGAWRLTTLTAVQDNTSYRVWVDDHAVNRVNCSSYGTGKSLNVILPTQSWIDPQTGRHMINRARKFMLCVTLPSNWTVTFSRSNETISTKPLSTNTSTTTSGTYLIECAEVERPSSSSSVFAVKITKISW